MSTLTGDPNLGTQAATDRPGWWRRRLHAWQTAEPLSPPPRSEWPASVHWALGLGLAVIVAQLIALCAWSAFEVHRFSLTPDFTTFAQPLALILRGDLSPYLSYFGHSFIRDHGVFLEYLLAPVVWLGPHAVLIKWAQAAALTGAEALALLWLTEIVVSVSPGSDSSRMSALIIGAAAVVLVANPWTFWAEAFDAHAGTFATLWAVGALRAVALNRRSRWLWFAAGLLTGDVSTSYQLAVGIGALLSSRRTAQTGLVMSMVAATWYEGLHVAGLTLSSGVGIYGDLLPVKVGPSSARGVDVVSVLTAMLAHPARVLRVLQGNAGRLWANVSPGGAIGVFYPPVLPLVVLALAESQLASPSTGFALAGFQSSVLYPVITVGTFALAIRLLRVHHRGLVYVLIAAVCVNALAWSALWLPQLSATWVRVPAPAARTLASVRRRIGPQAEVVVSGGEIGAFADRRWVFRIAPGVGVVPRRAQTVWFIVTPLIGIETAPVSASDGLISRLVSTPGVHEVADANGVWAFRWTPPPSVHTIRLTAPARVPAWTVSGSAGTVVHQGPPADWFVASNGKPGYVVAHDYFRELPGTYTATARLAASGPVRLELWNADTSTLLARTDFPGANTPVTVSVTGVLRHIARPHQFSGFGPWSEQQPLPAGGDQLELRVWSPGGNDAVSVYSLLLHRDGGP
ncbi:DUF2079 domain-containing protein [Conexibacter sp. DBS9H8]|uniref:DUF2079 domain-containing protein n=1 Tax=Conexibacter sp. DBS9H8 TaxID=2937801 RepID=UPI00200D4326|nr:DUF2079 domain-containing protein [Conexibacter sp. DBS9H8]